jgi:hypothetical protein
MGKDPDDAGAVHDTDAEALPAVAATLSGAVDGTGGGGGT